MLAATLVSLEFQILTFNTPSEEKKSRKHVIEKKFGA